MGKETKIINIELDSKGRFPIKKLEDLIDVSKIAFYSIEKEDGIIVLKFYNDKKKQIKAGAKNDNKRSKKRITK